MENLINALRSIGVYQFREESCYPMDNLQRNLSGRTHYFDDSTIRYFGCRVNGDYIGSNGLYICAIESVKHPSRGRLHRFVVFDVFGSVTSERDNFFRTADQARKAYWKFLSTFNPEKHTEDVLREKLAYDQKKIDDALKLLGD